MCIRDRAHALTALQHAAALLRDAPALWTHAPALLDALLLFAATAWAHALEHAPAFAALRTDAALWRALGDVLTADADTDAVRASCQARVLALVLADLHTRGTDAPQSLRMLAALAADAPRAGHQRRPPLSLIHI